MPEQWAWSAVSVWYNSTPPTFSSFFLLVLWSLFSSVTPFFLSLFFNPHPPPPPHLTATYLSYSLTQLCSASTSLWQMYSFSSLFYPVILPWSVYLVPFHSLFILFSVLPYCKALVAAIISTFCISALSFHVLFLNSLSTLAIFKGRQKVYRNGESHKALNMEKRGKKRSRGQTSKRGETKSSLLSFWWEKMSEGEIIKLEFFNTVKNGALTAHRQCKGQAWWATELAIPYIIRSN